MDDRRWLGELLQEPARWSQIKDSYVQVLEGGAEKPSKLEPEREIISPLRVLEGFGQPATLRVESPIQVRLFCCYGWSATPHPSKAGAADFGVWLLHPDPSHVPGKIEEKIWNVARRVAVKAPADLESFWRELELALDRLENRI